MEKVISAVFDGVHVTPDEALHVLLLILASKL
jgi:hypothetical protein